MVSGLSHPLSGTEPGITAQGLFPGGKIILYDFEVQGSTGIKEVYLNDTGRTLSGCSGCRRSSGSWLVDWDVPLDGWV
jgi:hypothetical protein